MEYYLLKPKKIISVSGIYSLHFFQFCANYAFKGERHDFWEIVYVDRGEADIGADERVIRLGPGQMIFHHPGEFHSIWVDRTKGADLCVVSFKCNSSAMKAFYHRACTLTAGQRQLLMLMIREGQAAFGPALDLYDKLVLRSENPPGCDQLIVAYLELLLLSLLREPTETSSAKPHAIRAEDDDVSACVAQAQQLMNARLDGTLRFSELCRALGISETVLKERFKQAAGMTVMEFYQRMRIGEARRMIRAGDGAVASIADRLGYSSPSAFTRQFKHLMGMTPSEYMRSIHK